MECWLNADRFTDRNGLVAKTEGSEFGFFVNGGVLLPRLGGEGEDAAYARIAELLPDREVVGLPVEMSAFGGGGLGCITQQVPAGPLLS